MTDGWLTGWKRIAEYMGVSVVTARRWYYKRGLPVKVSDLSVIAFKHELEAWAQGYTSRMGSVGINKILKRRRKDTQKTPK